METIQLIAHKRDSLRLLQKSGKQLTRSIRSKYPILCNKVNKYIARDRNFELESEAAQLSDAFSVSPFKGYSLLKQQHRQPTCATMPPESDFTDHYHSHYQPGPETPLDIVSCDPPTLIATSVDTTQHILQTLCDPRVPEGT